MVIVAAEAQGDLVCSVGICRGNQSDGEEEVKMEAGSAMDVSNVGDSVACVDPSSETLVDVLGMGGKERATGPRYPGQAVKCKVS